LIIVCPLHAAPALVLSSKASHAISLLSPESVWPEFPSLQPQRHLKLSLHDITAHSPGLSAPGANDAQRLVDFIGAWRAWDGDAPMLIHCWAGISRSTASAFTALCMARPDEDEMDLAQELRDASPSATPNALLVSHVDAILGRGGRMTEAVKSIGRGQDAYEGVPFRLKVKA
jgi:predicted protein tyrosine phosphatase